MQRQANPSRGTRRHQVTRLQGHKPRNIGQQLRRSEHHIRRRAALTHHTIHLTDQLQAGNRVNLIGAHNHRTKRSHRIPVLTLEPLRGTTLPVAHRHIIHDRVPHQSLKCLLLRGITQASAHDQAQLNLPVDFRAAGAVGGGHADLLAGANQRVRELREQRRMLGHLKVHFRGVVAVVQAGAHNLAGLIQRANKG